MMPARISVDFIRHRQRKPLSGFVLMAIGLCTLAWTFEDFSGTNASSAVLATELTLQASRDKTTKQQAVVTNPQEIMLARRQLLTPWSQLLGDLESAAQDGAQSIALLEIAPDNTKHRVRISGEARSLPHVFKYVSTLQSAGSLISPMLEMHEIQVSDKERPVRFIVAANWRTSE